MAHYGKITGCHACSLHPLCKYPGKTGLNIPSLIEKPPTTRGEEPKHKVVVQQVVREGMFFGSWEIPVLV